MYPYGWSAGESQRPRDTFKEFQAFSDAAREYAALRARGRSYNDIFEELGKRHRAANDNEDPVGDEAVKMMLSRTYMSMVACWLACSRDMVKTKLSWTEENQHTWTLD